MPVNVLGMRGSAIDWHEAAQHGELGCYCGAVLWSCMELVVVKPLLPLPCPRTLTLKTFHSFRMEHLFYSCIELHGNCLVVLSVTPLSLLCGANEAIYF